MDRIYDLNQVAMMTGFTTRTLRNYLNQGLLKGNKENGAWQFSAEELEKFFNEPFVKEGLRIKRSSAVFDFLADRNRKDGRTCIILDIPCGMIEGQQLSDFFCQQMEEVKDVNFNFDWDNNKSRIIITGASDQVEKIMKAYYIKKHNN